MSFYGLEFIYNDISSINYGLYISKIDGNGVDEASIGSEIELITKKILRNPVEFLYGVEQTPVLEFDIEFTSQNPLYAADRNVISAWLFGQQNRAKLQILQCDLQDIYFNCLLTSSQVTYVGNLAYGFKAHVICDSPFAWEYPKIITKTFSGSAIVNEGITVYNLSADNYYTYPTVSFTTSAIGNYCTIVNTTDNNRSFSFTGLLANETITVDCNKQIITTNSGLKRVSNFSLGWLRFIRGVNLLTIQGGITNYSITYPVARKVGA